VLARRRAARQREHEIRSIFNIIAKDDTSAMACNRQRTNFHAVIIDQRIGPANTARKAPTAVTAKRHRDFDTDADTIELGREALQMC
jgi:hypothetical protein